MRNFAAGSEFGTKFKVVYPRSCRGVMEVFYLDHPAFTVKMYLRGAICLAFLATGGGVVIRGLFV